MSTLKKHPLRFTPLVLALAATVAFADDASVQPVMVVTATRIAANPDTLSSDTTVLTATQLANSGAQTLGEALATVPGVQFSRSGGFGQPASLYIRGANANQTLVLVDGQRMGSATLGGTSFDLIPIASIDHVEILRGPASSLYGSDAVGGVVQIFTKRGQGAPHVWGGVEYGTDSTWGANAGLSASQDDTRISLGVSHKESEGFNVTKPANTFYYEPDRDGWHQTSANFDLSHFFGERNELGIRGLYVQSDSAFDSGGLPPNPWTRETQTNLSVYSRNQITDAWKSTLTIGQSQDQSHANSFDYNTFLPYTSRFDTRQKQVSWENRIDSSVGNWLLGLEYLNESVTSTATYDVNSRINRAALAGWQNDFGDHHLQANIRAENNSQFGDQTTGNIGYAWKFAKQWQFTANAGTSFHAPTFNDLYFDCGYVCSNPNLQAEKGRSADLGLRWDAAGWNTTLVGFENRIRNLIVLDANNNYIPENLSEGKIVGATLTTQGKLAGLDIGGSITRQNPFDADTGLLLPRRAKLFGDVTVAQSIGMWRWNADLQASGQRYDDAANTAANEMGGYGILGLGLDYKIAKTWKAGLRINNVFDRDYELVKNYNVQGRAYFVTLSYDGAGF
ncbi:TonB-dependent receptor domain-containing protein [Silvimonas sp.]|uniref:TonB-dependent receptor domain-containing protein n=1 Tax=Silvimonas sp. TaxID=2650811 RepID=UPI00283AC465|nr:TonB-dependent receptor [Silvimonas sp.]MDR3429309.1 TonB-dependent receptor [Silvimonas sp.]